MDIKEQEYKQVKMQVDNLNEQMDVNAENLGLGYLDMNSRMLQLEESFTEDKNQWSKRKEEHERRKERIENYWHRSTAGNMADLEKKVPKDKKGDKLSPKDSAYYANFSFKELEIMMKNSNRGGNSQEYNDVATELELFNALGEKLEGGEKLEILGRLSSFCNKYITTRNPHTSKGKCRKAMVEQLHFKVQLEEQKIKEETDAAYREIKEIKDSKKIPKDMVEKVINGKFYLLSRELKESIKDLSLEKMESMSFEHSRQDAQEDNELVRSMEALALQSVNADQSPTLSTKFFNAIGWTKRKPVKSWRFSEDVEKSPVRVKLYHTIAAIPLQNAAKKSNAFGMVEQLVGDTEDNRQYLSSGNYGRGTYTASRGFEYQDADEKTGNQLDKEASEHSWSFGKTNGSMQVTMTFNHNAKIISFMQARVLLSHFEKKYPKFYAYVNRNEERGGYRFPQLPYGASIILAFYGYNTIHVPRGSSSDTVFAENGMYAPLDYYVTFDRSAFTVYIDNYGIRNEDGDIKVYDD